MSKIELNGQTSEGKDTLPSVHSTAELQALSAGHHAGSEAHVAGLKEAGHELASAEDRHLNTGK